jgi:hypothetical protein
MTLFCHWECFLSFREYMSLPQPACEEPLSPVHVLGVWLIHKCFAFELFHSCKPGFLIISLIQQFVYVIFQEEVCVKAKSTHNHYTVMAEHLLFHVWGGSMMWWAHTTCTLFWLNVCFWMRKPSLFQHTTFCMRWGLSQWWNLIQRLGLAGGYLEGIMYPFAIPDPRFRICYWSGQAYNAHGGKVINPLTPKDL